MSGPTRKGSDLRLVQSGGRVRGRYAKRAALKPHPAADAGDPPEHLNSEQQAHWRRLVADAPAGLFTALDRDALEGYVVLLDVRDRCLALVNDVPAVVVHSSRDKRDQIAPALRELKRVVALLRVLGGDLGLSPASRGRVSVAKPPEDDPLARFLQPPPISRRTGRP